MSYLYQQHFKGLHSHNDYLQTSPLSDALSFGFEAIEIDVFLISGVLKVGHDISQATSGSTIVDMYLDPLDALVPADQPRRIVVDLKNNPSSSAFTELVSLLGNYPNLDDEHLEVLITGNMPSFAITHPTYVTFTGQCRQLSDLTDGTNYLNVQLDFADFSTWDGLGSVPENVINILREASDTAHAHGKELRVFGAPSTIASWQAQYDAGVDWIAPGGAHPPGADDLAGLAAWFNAL